MPERSAEWTVDLVRTMPDDGNRYEVIDGELFLTPPPNVWHQSAVSELFLLVGPYVAQPKIGKLFTAPADVVYGPRNAVQPDLFVSAVPDGALPKAWEELPPPRLAIEIISPSTRLTDRREKRELYQRKGVAEYWIVDVEGRTVERWRPNDSAGELLTGTLEWRPIS